MIHLQALLGRSNAVVLQMHSSTFANGILQQEDSATYVCLQKGMCRADLHFFYANCYELELQLLSRFA